MHFFTILVTMRVHLRYLKEVRFTKKRIFVSTATASVKRLCSLNHKVWNKIHRWAVFPFLHLVWSVQYTFQSKTIQQDQKGSNYSFLLSCRFRSWPLRVETHLGMCQNLNRLIFTIQYIHSLCIVIKMVPIVHTVLYNQSHALLLNLFCNLNIFILNPIRYCLKKQQQCSD